jgi:saccharopine dehydrogenase (NADP+, L-glutamate forming)
MAHIHWLGAGLSTRPGIHRLASAGHALTVWNRTLRTAELAVKFEGSKAEAAHFENVDSLTKALAPGDIVVSMLPGDFHISVAEACLAAGCHFISSSYISPEMRALDGAFKDAGLCCVNEVGLDPGIDHLMAHVLVQDYRESAAFDPSNELAFTSYCGGLSDIPNEFRYKFSWSPLGVLKALRSPSRSIRNGDIWDVARPWDAVESREVPLPDGGHQAFEVYPNRDSLPFMAQYEFDDAWNVSQFVRGTLRLDGWADAWSDIFAQVETMTDDELKALSDRLWQENSFAEGEADRVVLAVSLTAQRDAKTVYSKTYCLDAKGDETGSAMARLVSVPVSYAVEAVKAGELAAGVQAAPHDPAVAASWLAALKLRGEPMALIDHLA